MNASDHRTCDDPTCVECADRERAAALHAAAIIVTPRVRAKIESIKRNAPMARRLGFA
jgi:hypothetical protein